jgi:hypothetical protein
MENHAKSQLNFIKTYYDHVLICSHYVEHDRLCGLVVRVPG